MTCHKKAQAVRRDARQADQGRQLHHSNFLTGIALQNSIEGSGCPVYGCNGKGMVLGYNANYGGGVDVKIGCSTGDASHERTTRAATSTRCLRHGTR